jgi:adenylosuccinate synthase
MTTVTNASSTDAEDAPAGGADGVPGLDQLGMATGHAAVVGLQWGDEGKGQLVDLLTRQFDLVARYNGGNNAGHSVQVGSEKFALHLLPSGIISPSTINVVGNGVVVDPAGILEEIDGLTERGVAIDENLKISNRAHVVFPYHKVQDKLYDLALGRAAGEGQKIGTTGRGIGPCYADKALRSTAVRMGQLLNAEELGKQLRRIVALKNLLLGALAAECGEPFEPFDAEAMCQQYVAYGQRLAPHICDTARVLQEAIDNDQRILFEGANANLLDVDHGTYPFVTSSNCSSLGIYAGAGVPGGTLEHVLGIVKLYTSRVGGGPFPTELHADLGEELRTKGKEYGTTTGRPRRCGWLDLVATRYTAKLSGVTALACTGLSVIADIDPLQICVGYSYRGQRLDHFPADADTLAAVEPIYEQMPGFAGPIDECARFDDLPDAARAYVAFVEQFVGVPITMVCVGRRRDQVLLRQSR